MIQQRADSEEETESKEKKPGSLVVESKTLLWRMSTRRFDTSRPEWIYGQVTINSENPYRVRVTKF